MPGNSIGSMFRVTTYGESHGPVVGCVIDGCPPCLAISTTEINLELARRRPGNNQYTSQRRESDEVIIQSGIFNGKTTGAAINLQIANENAKSKDYSDLEDKFRPGHADYTYQHKYGIRDHLGGGRASARTTAAIVAAGAIAKKYLQHKLDISFACAVVQIGPISAEQINLYSDNEFNFADASKVNQLSELITSLRRSGDSVGAKLRLQVYNVPTGLGEPVFSKLDADLAGALMGLNAVKAVEIGAGILAASSLGSKFNDEISPDGFLSNNAGGILGGISTGQDLDLSIYFKPAASIRIPQQSIDINNDPIMLATTGRHDPCVGIRAVPIVEALAAIVIMDHFLRHRGQNEYSY